MKYTYTARYALTSLVLSALLLGCGSNSSDSLVANGSNIVGSVVKGPIDGATLHIYDASGKLLATSRSKKGLFRFDALSLESPYYTMESLGGSYEDEATKKIVNVKSTEGLKTFLTREELQAMLTNKEFVAMTPETTIYTELVLNDMKNGRDINSSMGSARAMITNNMIQGSSPLQGVDGDKFLQKGDFTTAFPKDASESFARNRAVSFSYMTRDLNVAPEKVFDMMQLVADDYKDGKADGITLNDGRDVNVSEEFALSRTKLFQNTTNKMRNGELNEGQISELSKMGFNTTMFANTATKDDTNLQTLVDKYLVSTTLPTLHRLPLLKDEDGNATDGKESYTLRAREDVNVTIETPDGSWITPMWRYNNNPLPVLIRTSRGTAMKLTLDNQLSADSTIHWHGFKIPAIMDGGPDMPVAPKTTKTYSFTMNQPAAPLWFHPHPDMETGKQVYMGLAGVYLLQDSISKELEATKALPSGDKDAVLLVQDRRFVDEGNGIKRLAYKTKEADSDGMYGDTILVNGSVMPKQEVSNTLHRYRLYNVSNARTYDFALSDGSSFTIIGTDGGLLEKPVSTNHIMLGAAERVEIVIDFSKYSIGDKVLLISKAFNGDMMNMLGTENSTTLVSGMGSMGSGMGNMGTEVNVNQASGGLSIMRFDVTKSESEDIKLYDRLPSNAEIINRLSTADTTTSVERQFLMSMGGMGSSMGRMNFVINGKSFDINRVDEYLAAGAKEIWSIRNMSPMAHPFHAHAIQYQILSRNGVPASGVDLGWKDTFLVQPGESVRIIGDFSSAEGDYMYHCHILEHEDAGMMGYFRVGDTGNLDNKK